MSNKTKYSIKAAVGSSIEVVYERSFDTKEERDAYAKGLDDGIGWMEFRSEAKEEASEPEAIILKMGRHAKYIREQAKKEGVSFKKYAEYVFGKGLAFDKSSL